MGMTEEPSEYGAVVDRVSEDAHGCDVELLRQGSRLGAPLYGPLISGTLWFPSRPAWAGVGRRITITATEAK